MLQSLKNTLKNHKTLVGNIFSLGTLQIFNYIIPLITLPYILRVLGPEKYGIVAFSGAFIGYFVILINYGFNFTATKDISMYRGDTRKVSEIFWNVFFIKGAIALLSSIVVTILVITFKIFSGEYQVIFFSFLIVFGEILFPVWLFQGMERMKYITIINVVIRIVFLFPVFLFIKTTEDYAFLPLITSLTSVISGGIAFILALRLFRLKFILPSIASLKYYLKEGWHIFISTIFISLYTTSTTFILGIFTTPAVVGYYASAEKLVKAAQGLMGPISQAIYPNIVQKLQQSREKTIIFIQKITILVGIGFLILSVFLFFSAEYFVYLLFGIQFQKSVLIVRILSLLPFIVGLSNIFGVLTMLPLGYKKKFSQILMFSSFFSIAISIPLTIVYAEIGMAVSVLLTEALIMGSMFIFLYKKDFFG